jgi:hypothetical protein
LPTLLLLFICKLSVSLLAIFKTLFNLEAVVKQPGFEQLGVNHNTTFNCLKLEGLGREAKDKRSPSLSFSLKALCLHF